MDERTLVEAAGRGEAAAFEQLVARYQAPLAAAAYQLVGHAEDARDAVQETFIDAYRGLRRLRAPEKFRGWLFAILRRRCGYVLAHRRHEAPLDDALRHAAPAAEETRALWDAISRLPRADREIITARYYCELDYDEVARALGITVRAARMRCLRARERLREVLRQDDEEQARLAVRHAVTGLAALCLPEDFAAQVRHSLPAAPATLAGGGTLLLVSALALALIGGVAVAILNGAAAALARHPEVSSLVQRATGQHPPAYYIRTLPTGATLTFHGLCYDPEQGRPWWRPDGRPQAAPTRSISSFMPKLTGDCRKLLFTVRTGPPWPSTMLTFGTGRSYDNLPVSWGGHGGNVPGGWEQWYVVDLTDNKRLPPVVNVRFGVALGQWRTLAALSAAHPRARYVPPGGSDIGTMTLREANGRVRVTADISDWSPVEATRLIAIDRAGTLCYSDSSSSRNEIFITNFPLSPAQLREIRYEARPYHWEDFADVRLNPR